MSASKKKQKRSPEDESSDEAVPKLPNEPQVSSSSPSSKPKEKPSASKNDGPSPARLPKKTARGDAEKEGDLGVCLPTIQILSSEAFNEVMNGRKQEDIITSSVDSSKLKVATSIKVNEIKFVGQHGAPNLWCGITESDSQFVAQVVLFGICWRINGLIAGRVSSIKCETANVSKFDIKDCEVWKEVGSQTGKIRSTWKRVAPSRLGIRTESKTPVVVHFSVK